MSAAPPESVDWPARLWWQFCIENPSDIACEDVGSYYEYTLSMAANATFLALFSISFIGYIVTYGVTRRGLAFGVAMVLGVLCEILGYAGRVWSASNRFLERIPSSSRSAA
jgi:hypothetical protein